MWLAKPLLTQPEHVVIQHILIVLCVLAFIGWSCPEWAADYGQFVLVPLLLLLLLPRQKAMWVLIGVAIVILFPFIDPFLPRNPKDPN